VGGGPGGVVLVEPLADAAVHANVVADFLGLQPLVFEDFIELVHDAEPEGLFGEGVGGLEVERRGPSGGLFDYLFVLEQSGDGELEELDDLGGEIDLLGVVVSVGGGEDKRAAGDDVFAGEQRKVLAAGNAKLISAVVNLAEENRRQGNADGRQVVFARFPQNGAIVANPEERSTE
jgi:hypothetical protein